MDSLTSVEMRNKLQVSLECSLPTTLAFDYPTVTKLVDYLIPILDLDDDLEPETETALDDIAKKLAEQLGTH